MNKKQREKRDAKCWKQKQEGIRKKKKEEKKNGKKQKVKQEKEFE